MAMTKKTKPGSANITLAQPLARSAYTEKYLGLFWSDFLPGSRQFSDSASSLSPGAWTTVVYDRRANDRPINLAILALSLCDAGRRTSDSSLTHMGLEAYGRALLQLGSALRQPIRGDLSTAIGTTILFDAFEIFFGGNQPDKSMTPSRGWTEHTRGQLAIILSQPPEAFQAPGMHELFIDARYFTLLESFKARKRLPLLSPEWMTIPWGDRPKTPNDKLIDIVAEMTAIFEDLDRIETTQDLKARDQKRRLVLADCWHIDRRLQKWCTENSPLKEFRKDGVRIALDPTGPEDFALGHMTIVFWTASLGLYSQMQKLAAAERNLKLPPRMHPESYAQRIAYALPFLLRPGHLTMGATLAAAPLWMLMAIPEFNSPEVNNMLSLLMNSPETRTISNFMSSLDGDTEHWRTSKGWTI